MSAGEFRLTLADEESAVRREVAVYSVTPTSGAPRVQIAITPTNNPGVLTRAQVAALHSELGAWLEAHPAPPARPARLSARLAAKDGVR